MHLPWKKNSGINLTAAVLTDGVLLHATLNLLNCWHGSLRAKTWTFFFYPLPIFTHPDDSQMKMTFVPAGVGKQIPVADIMGNRFSFIFHRNGIDTNLSIWFKRKHVKRDT